MAGVSCPCVCLFQDKHCFLITLGRIELEGWNFLSCLSKTCYNRFCLEQDKRGAYCSDPVSSYYACMVFFSSPWRHHVWTTRVKSSWVESSWVDSSQVELSWVKLSWVELSRVESSQVEMSWDKSKRVKSSRVEISWVLSSRVESSQVELSC